MLLTEQEAIRKELNELDELHKRCYDSSLDLDTRMWAAGDYEIALCRFEYHWGTRPIYDASTNHHMLDEGS